MQEQAINRPRECARALLIAAALLISVTGCQKEKGPAERAGAEIDKATEKVGQQLERAGDRIQDPAKSDKK